MMDRADQEWPESETQTTTARNFRAEMQQVILNILGGAGCKSVKLTVEGHTFRCVPAEDGRVILYKDGGRIQYHVMELDSWASWATESAEV